MEAILIRLEGRSKEISKEPEEVALSESESDSSVGEKAAVQPAALLGFMNYSDSESD